MSEEQKNKIHAEKSAIQRVVIIGGGFAGIRASLDLLKKSKNVYPVRNPIYKFFKNIFRNEIGGEISNGVYITLIDKNPYHSYHPDYYEVAATVLKELKEMSISQFSELHSTVAIHFEDIFQNEQNINFLYDAVSEIDFENSFVKTEHKKEIHFDWLIVAAGSKTSYYNIPLIKELSYELKSVNDGLNIRNGIDELFERKGKREKIIIIIGGGGFTGCELAGELNGYIKHLLAAHKRPAGSVEIKIIEASPSLLSGASAWTQEKAKKRLENLGIKILLDSQIEKVSSPQNENAKFSSVGSVHLKNGEELNYDILIWTAGVEAAGISKIFPAKTIQKKLCLKTDKHLLISPFKNVFAVGDIAYCVNPASKNPLAMTAQTAISQGRYAAYAILQKIKKKKLKPYKPKQSKFIIPLGGKYALADLGFIRFSGFFAWAFKHLVTLRYFISILPLFFALKLWLKGMRIYIKND